MISVHGLIRGKDLELGRDADTGGQTTYVVELANALTRSQSVDRVDLLTRRVEDPQVSGDYSKEEEFLNEKGKILRLPCGPKRYLRKETLWPHLDQMVDRCLHFLRRQNRLPDFIHTHYADAGYVGRQLSLLLGIPQIHTGHSLGRTKRKRLLASGRKEQAIERQFNLARRIAVEEDVLKHASLIVTSTRQEIEEQYGMYLNHPRRCVVIPPGIDTSRFSPPGRRKAVSKIQGEIDRFLCQPEKPMILSICRAESRKNLKGLIEAYGTDPRLRKKANLVVVAGNREDIRELDDAQSLVLGEMLFDIDRHDLWGSVAFPKHHSSRDVPELYRLAAKRRGVFVNSALTEPFGLTLIEAAASGLPFVAPNDGGPKDIVSNCRSGLLVDTLDAAAISAGLNHVLAAPAQWRKWSKQGISGVKRHYSWDAHVEKYLRVLRQLQRRDRKRLRREFAFAHRLPSMPLRWQNVLMSDIDNTLIGHRDGLNELVQWLREHARQVAFGIATGRTLESTIKVLRSWKVPMPNILVTSVGTEINYGPNLLRDDGWSNHIRYQWRRDALEEALIGVPGIELQSLENQREFKLSYNVNPGLMPPLSQIHRRLRERNLHARLVYSHEAYLDVLPIRASKGHAIRYLAYKWGLPLENFLVAGDSGNDEEMLLGDTLAVVVGNHSAELESLRGIEQIYFAGDVCARGILEGIRHYGFGESGKAE